MPKIKKDKVQRQEKVRKLEDQKTLLKHSMFKSAWITYLIAFIFLIISFVFNGNLIKSWVELVQNAITTATEQDSGPEFITVLDYIFKSLSIILFFFFIFVSIGNLQELRGYIVTWKEMIFLLVITLIQASTDSTVFIISASGVILIMFYMYFIQGRVEKEYED